MNILHIDSSILGEGSASRALTAKAVARHTGADTTVTYRDLAAAPLGHLTGAEFLARNADIDSLDPAVRADREAGDRTLDEFLAADLIVIGAPMYNFSIPSQLKAWIDRVSVAGKTFRYTEAGPEGLAMGKKIVVISSRGGAYSEGAAKAMDFQEAYLAAVFGFLGVTDIEFVRAERLGMGPEVRGQSLAAAESALAASFPIAA